MFSCFGQPDLLYIYDPKASSLSLYFIVLLRVEYVCIILHLQIFDVMCNCNGRITVTTMIRHYSDFIQVGLIFFLMLLSSIIFQLSWLIRHKHIVFNSMLSHNSVLENSHKVDLHILMEESVFAFIFEDDCTLNHISFSQSTLHCLKLLK